MSAGEVLSRALHLRDPWTPVDGLFPYPAGLHPGAAALLLRLLPPGRVLDPFVGGGAVALAARRAGRPFSGRDVSEAALCVTRARCWRPEETEIEAFLAAVHAVGTPDRAPLPEPLRSAVDATIASAGPGRPRGRLAAAAARAWRSERARHGPPTTPLDLAVGDARSLEVDAPVAGILTSPPYPGVYDYDRWTRILRTARGQQGDISEEIGTRRDFARHLQAALIAWRADTMAWTARAADALAPGGRMIIVIGDGPRPDGPVDTLHESIAAGQAAGLRCLAASSAEPGTRPSPRREHALVFERPSVG